MLRRRCTVEDVGVLKLTRRSLCTCIYKNVEVKLSLYTPRRLRRGVEVSSTHSYPRHWLEVSGVPYAPADLPPEKSCLVTVVQEAEWFPEPVCTFWRREKMSCLCIYRIIRHSRPAHYTVPYREGNCFSNVVRHCWLVGNSM